MKNTENTGTESARADSPATHGSGHVEHTPAPWKAVQGNDGEPERWLVVAAGAMQYHIAVIENGQPGDCLETEGATAHLIAVAPELLDAVKNFVADHWVSRGCKPCSCNVCRMGNAAIAKASVQNDQAELTAAINPKV